MSQVAEGFYFITNRTDHNEYVYRSEKIKVTDNVALLDNYLDAKAFGYDVENNGGKFHLLDLLLISIGDRKHQFVIDATAPLFARVKEVLNDRFAQEGKLAIGHNIKHDDQVSKQSGIYLPKVFDTMVGHQRATLGREELLANLEDVHIYWLNSIMDTDKEIRKDFLKMNKRSKFMPKHIIYSGGDIKPMVDLARAIMNKLREYGQYEWVKDVEFNLTPILADMEMEGIYCNPVKWRTNIEERKKESLLSQRKLDQLRAELTGVKVKPRNKVTVIQNTLFGDAPTEIENLNTRHLNYSSSKQVLDFIRSTNEPIPLLKKKGQVTESVSESAILPYLIERPTSKLKPFLSEYIEYKGHEKFISSYGLKFLYPEIRKKRKIEQGFVNPITGKVHTSYKQCFTDTGRLASGNVKAGLFNSQNLPAKTAIRQAFGLTEEEIRDGWFITTCDLSGAELIIMAALADDQHLYELGADKVVNGVKVEGDLHSPIATKCWRAVYQYRMQKQRALTIFDSENKPYQLTADFVIDKKNNKPLRVDFKPMTFGTVYGLKAPKGGQTLNIPPDEAQVIIDVIRNEFPRTFAMVEQAAAFALADGYVVFNSVSNNRRWFSAVLAAHARLKIADRTKRYHAVQQELPFKELSEIEGAARNCRIQGTQADMLKESHVRIQEYAIKHKIEMKQLLTVHDELVIKHKGKAFGDDIAEIMTTTANRYLSAYSSNIRMKADHQTLTTWTK